MFKSLISNNIISKIFKRSIKFFLLIRNYLFIRIIFKKIYFIRLISLFSFGALLTITIVISLNFIVDPYGIYGANEYKNFNYYKPLLFKNSRATKPIIIDRLKPEAVIFGASTSEMGFDPNHSGFKKYNRTYNFGVGGGYFYEVYRHFQHASNITNLKLAIISIDYIMWLERDSKSSANFNENFLSVNYENNQNLSWNNRLAWSLSPARISDGLTTLLYQDTSYVNKDFFPRYFLNKNGQRREDSYPRILKIYKGFDYPFKKNLYVHAKKLKKNNADKVNKRWINNDTYFDLIEKIVFIAKKNNTKLIFNFPPCHLSAKEIYRESNKLNSFISFKIKIANSLKRLQSNYHDISLYDFCIYDEILSEKSLTKRNLKVPMNSFADPFHFTSSMGDEALNFMLLGKSTKKGFGKNLLQEDDLEKYFQSNEHVYQKIKQTHKEELNKYQNCFHSEKC